MHRSTSLSSVRRLRFLSIALAFALTALFASQAVAGPPTSKEEADKAIAKATSSSPEDTVKLWFEACFLVSAGGDKAAIGSHILIAITNDLNDDWKEKSSSRTFLERLETQPWIFKSYVKGTTPENGYEVDASGFELDIASAGEDPYGKGYAIKLQSSGATNPRPIYVTTKEDGTFEVAKFAAIYSGVTKPSK